MSFELWNTRGGSRWAIGSFKTLVNGQVISLPEGMKGEAYNKYIDRKNKIIKIQLDKNGAFTSQSGIGLGKKTKEFFNNEENLIGYLDEDAIYLASYNDGQEAFEKFLRSIKII